MDTSRAVALGFFDGVHIGHGALLRRTRAAADRLGCPAAAMSFDTHPSALLSASPSPLLSTMEERTLLMRRLYGMDEVIFEEFKGTGNMELRLSRELADKRLFPAIDVNASGTRREELITDPQELPIIYRLRRLLGGLEPEQAYQTLVPRLKKTATNRDFMASLIQQSGNATNGN